MAFDKLNIEYIFWAPLLFKEERICYEYNMGAMLFQHRFILS